MPAYPLRCATMVAALLLTLLPPVGRADVVILKDGRTFQGKIIQESDGAHPRIIIDAMIAGIRAEMPVAKEDIASITLQEVPADFFDPHRKSPPPPDKISSIPAAPTTAPQASPPPTAKNATDPARNLVPLPPGPLHDHGLLRSGSTLVLADEAPLLESLRALGQTRKQADAETSDRHSLELRIAGKRRIIRDTQREWEHLEAQIALTQDVKIHNNMVLRMNKLFADQKEAVAALKDLEERAAKFNSAAKTNYVDALAALAPGVDATLHAYQRLAADANVRDALAGQSPPATLGPSAEFAAAAADFQAWQAEVESEAIPLHEDNGTFLVDALLNGEHFQLAVDTGASCISLSADVAHQLNLNPGAKDPTVQLHLADGNVIEGKEMALGSVRVGRFTLANVPCVVLSKGLPHAPLLLGGSFLNHFIVKMDPSKSELRLTDLKDAAASSH
jgi:aspartyl protease family protein